MNRSKDPSALFLDDHLPGRQLERHYDRDEAARGQVIAHVAGCVDDDLRWRSGSRLAQGIGWWQLAQDGIRLGCR